jgi:hypothetical protein
VGTQAHPVKASTPAHGQNHQMAQLRLTCVRSFVNTPPLRTTTDHIKPDYIDSNITVKIYDYIKLRARSSSSFILSIKIIVKVYIHVIFTAIA